MLARRFTIVCLLVTLFGMGFAILVADAGRSKRHEYARTLTASSCMAGPGLLC